MLGREIFITLNTERVKHLYLAHDLQDDRYNMLQWPRRLLLPNSVTNFTESENVVKCDYIV